MQKLPAGTLWDSQDVEKLTSSVATPTTSLYRPNTTRALSSLGAVAPFALPPEASTTPTTPTETPIAEPQSGAMHTGFVSALTKLKQKERAAGRTTTPTDLAEVGRGYFGEAAERMATSKGLALQERGLDIEDRRIASAEKMHRAGLISDAELERQRLTSAEKMHKAGLISTEELEWAKIRATKAMHEEEMKLGYYEAKTQSRAAERAAEESGGLFGGGGFLGLGICIIITACTSPDSHEVNVARQYRDGWLGPVTLAGYYALSHKIVPIILWSKIVKRLVKKILVDRLTDYFEWFLGCKSHRQLHTSKYVTKGFLGFCKAIGSLMARGRAIEYLVVHAGRTSPAS